MIYYSLTSLFRGVLLSVVLGALFAILSVAFDTVFDCLGAFLRLPRDVIRALGEKTRVKEYLDRGLVVRGRTRKAWLIFKDALFLIICGFLSSLLLYLAVDGEIRIYVLLIVFASYTVLRKSFGELLHGFLTKVAQIILTAISVILFAVAFAVRISFVRARFIVKKIHVSQSKRKAEKRFKNRKSKIVQNSLKNDGI